VKCINFNSVERQKNIALLCGEYEIYPSARENSSIFTETNIFYLTLKMKTQIKNQKEKETLKIISRLHIEFDWLTESVYKR
jgi:hypothetical protein